MYEFEGLFSIVYQVGFVMKEHLCHASATCSVVNQCSYSALVAEVSMATVDIAVHGIRFDPVSKREDSNHTRNQFVR